MIVSQRYMRLNTFYKFPSTYKMSSHEVPSHEVPSHEVSSSYDTLVLAGGAAKGLVILGSIQSAMDMNLLHSLKNYVGTSVGAIICYLLILGYTPIEIMLSLHRNRWLEKMHAFDVVKFSTGNGAASFTPLQEALEKLTIDKVGKFYTLGKLKEVFGKNLVAVTYNMTTCQTEYLSAENHPDLPCLTALRMSCNIPLIFDRFKYMDNFYIDGGISENFPINKGEEIGEKVLGIYLELDETALKDEPEEGMISYFLKLLQIPIIQSTKYRVKLSGEKCTVIPIKSGQLRNVIEFDVKSKVRLDMFSSGYESVQKFFLTLSPSIQS